MFVFFLWKLPKSSWHPIRHDWFNICRITYLRNINKELFSFFTAAFLSDWFYYLFSWRLIKTRRTIFTVFSRFCSIIFRTASVDTLFKETNCFLLHCINSYINPNVPTYRHRLDEHTYARKCKEKTLLHTYTRKHTLAIIQTYSLT